MSRVSTKLVAASAAGYRSRGSPYPLGGKRCVVLHEGVGPQEGPFEPGRRDRLFGGSVRRAGEVLSAHRRKFDDATDPGRFGGGDEIDLRLRQKRERRGGEDRAHPSQRGGDRSGIGVVERDDLGAFERAFRLGRRVRPMRTLRPAAINPLATSWPTLPLALATKIVIFSLREAERRTALLAYPMETSTTEPISTKPNSPHDRYYRYSTQAARRDASRGVFRGVAGSQAVRCRGPARPHAIGGQPLRAAPARDLRRSPVPAPSQWRGADAAGARPRRAGQAALAQLRAALESGRVFDPAKLRRVFRVGTLDYMLAVVGPAIVGRLARLAPQCAIVFASVTGSEALKRLRKGADDLAVGAG